MYKTYMRLACGENDAAMGRAAGGANPSKDNLETALKTHCIQDWQLERVQFFYILCILHTIQHFVNKI